MAWCFSTGVTLSSTFPALFISCAHDVYVINSLLTMLIVKIVFNEELHNSYYSPNCIRVTKSGSRTCSNNMEIRNAYKIFLGKTRREESTWET
jgi:hypothetical protein